MITWQDLVGKELITVSAQTARNPLSHVFRWTDRPEMRGSSVGYHCAYPSLVDMG